MNGRVVVTVLPTRDERLPSNTQYPFYIHEVLQHAGLCYTKVKVSDVEHVLDQSAILVTVGEGKLEGKTANRLVSWVRSGGAWISIAGVCGLSELLGISEEEPPSWSWASGPLSLGEGYLKPSRISSFPLMDTPFPLHFFDGIPARASGCRVLATALDAYQQDTGFVAVGTTEVGKGLTVFVAPDITGAIVRIQQGCAVTRKGVGAPLCASAFGDNELMACDGRTLHWLADRTPIESIPGFRAFLEPVADHWRSLILRLIFHAASSRESPLALLWLYPRDIPALAHLSHDTETNRPEKGRELLNLLEQLKVKSTWCISSPGYAQPELHSAIKAAGHELAMHYNALTEDGGWSRASFERQCRQLRDSFNEPILTNKNHYLRWEGDTEFYEWCIGSGIGVDQSKGPSKPEEAGFLFGTCHPYAPVNTCGQILDVLELPVHIQDPGVFAPGELCSYLIKAVASAYGVFHLLIHPDSLGRGNLQNSLGTLVSLCRGMNMEWWTSARLFHWLRARRQMQWRQSISENERSVFSLHLREGLPGATVLMLMPAGTYVLSDECEQTASRTVRWGFPFESYSMAESKGMYGCFEVVRRA